MVVVSAEIFALAIISLLTAGIQKIFFGGALKIK
jgi:hypothetical protein